MYTLREEQLYIVDDDDEMTCLKLHKLLLIAKSLKLGIDPGWKGQVWQKIQIGTRFILYDFAWSNFLHFVPTSFGKKCLEVGTDPWYAAVIDQDVADKSDFFTH